MLANMLDYYVWTFYSKFTLFQINLREIERRQHIDRAI